MASGNTFTDWKVAREKSGAGIHRGEIRGRLKGQIVKGLVSHLRRLDFMLKLMAKSEIPVTTIIQCSESASWNNEKRKINGNWKGENHLLMMW